MTTTTTTATKTTTTTTVTTTTTAATKGGGDVRFEDFGWGATTEAIPSNGLDDNSRSKAGGEER